MPSTTLLLDRTQEIVDFDGLDNFDTFNGANDIDDDGTLQLIEAIEAERNYIECAYYDSAW